MKLQVMAHFAPLGEPTSVERRYEMDELQAGNVVGGPAVIEHPATTLLIPPTHHVEFDSRRLIHYRAGQA
jgi:acetone carboxylase, beta subunit